MAKVHGSITQAGKVRNLTKKVPKAEKKTPVRGRAHTRLLYNKRKGFDPSVKRKIGPNHQGA